MIQRGDILDGKYEITRLIDRGGMSKVWKAMDTHVNRDWAVKEIDKTSKEYENTVNEQKTLREIELMKKLEHNSLPRIVDIIDRKDCLCIVMDYIPGDNLYEILKTRGIPDQETVVSWMLDVCDTLNYLHHCDPPIIYRDLKPANIMLTPDQRIKIIDFGIAREYKKGSKDTQPLGTRGYASPEHFSKNTDARSDVYTVGTTMYQLLTGKDPTEPPYHMVPIRTVDPSLSSGLEKIILKATEDDPDERYQTMAELANALESYKSLEQEHIDYLEEKQTSFRRGLISGIAMLLLGAILFASGFFVAGRTYSTLIETTQGSPAAVENYTKAIRLDPGRVEAYQKLLGEYTANGELTDQELTAFLTVYEENKPSLTKNKERYSDINYSIGESILTYYTGKSDRSARAKLLQAQPFFSEVKEGSSVRLAKTYVFLAEFYRNYIMADSTLVVKGATKEAFDEFFKACNDAIDGLQEADFSGREKMKAITYEFILSLAETQAGSMHAAGASKEEAAALIERMKEDPESTDELRKLADSALKSLDRGYTEKNSKEVTYSDDTADS